jgi:hypothetical protein
MQTNHAVRNNVDRIRGMNQIGSFVRMLGVSRNFKSGGAW